MPMQTPINKDNIPSFAYTNEELLAGANKTPAGILVEFHGLGGGLDILHEHPKLGHYCAERGVLYVLPYYGPWSWMCDKSVRYTDEVVAAIFEHFGLPDNTPVVSSGYSMGGLAALVYTRYAARTPAACDVICPVCDLPFHYTEREDLPRTIYGALSHYDMPLSEAMKRSSPVDLANEMPKIPYLVFHTTADGAVRKDMHSDRFVAAMRERGHDIGYVEVPDRGHCDLSKEAAEQYKAFATSFVL